MVSIKDLQEQLLANGQHAVFTGRKDLVDAVWIVVLKEYKYHRQLCIELYQAGLTKGGKIKNPLSYINPLDAALKTVDPEELRFFSAISRFQNNPTAAKSSMDIETLKVIIKNPLQLKFFYHNPEFSPQVAAGSIHEVKVGHILNNLTLMVNKSGSFYQFTSYINIEGRSYPLQELDIRYDYFILRDDILYLLGNFHILKVVQFFRQNRSGLELHESKFKEFQQHVLSKLENHVSVVYTHIQAATNEQKTETGIDDAMEKLIYLSEMGQYIQINPVMKYGAVEIPVRSQKQIYAKDAAGEVVMVQRNDREEDRFMAMLIRQLPDVDEQLENDFSYFYMHRQKFLSEDWFLNAFEQWRQQGITVLGFNQLRGNKLNGNKAEITVQVTSGLNWFNADLDVRFGKKKAALKQLQRSVRNNNRFVQLDDGTVGILPEEWMNKLAACFNAGEIVDDQLIVPKVNFSSVAQLYKAEELDEKVQQELALYQKKFLNFGGIKEVEVPEELHATLRSYQRHGLNWLNFLDDFNFGGCLADDMGLGKTLQVIAFILLQRKKVGVNCNLIVVPTSLLFNWQAEVQKFAPSIKMKMIYGPDRIKLMKDIDRYEIVLTSYGTLLSDIGWLKNHTFNYVFLDESQNIKNIESQRYQAVRMLKSRNKIAITGTPVENNTLDLYAQLSFTCPGLLGSKQSFRDLFSIPVDQFKSSRRLKELQQRIAPFILRRTKKEVAPELPEKTEIVLYCPMEESQRKVYDAYENEIRNYIEGKTDEDLSNNTMYILKGLTHLRQICDAPELLKDESLQGEGSAKMNVLMEQIENNAPGHKILVFSQFVSMLDLIRKELQSRNIEFEYLTGSTKNREEVVNNFQNNPDVRVFLISLKAGGTGLNLTEADYVYLVDPWWNPAVENQAIDRSYRIGQKKNVVAVRLICPDTVEEKIMKLQKTKRSLSDDLIQSETSFFKSMTKDDWLSVLR